MANTDRINEILAQIIAFSKREYRREEFLPELLELQKQMIHLLFNESHAELSGFKIWDVENYLKNLNEECGGVADDEVQKVIEGCKIICNMIKSEISGIAGERKAFRSLETVRNSYRLLKNVEMGQGEHRTELDAVMFMKKAVYLIEVKNPGKDIYIDERGNYCRVGQVMTFDKNIGEKMNDKTFLLREALKKTGNREVNIISLVVFTNNSIQVNNDFPYITTCFLSDLPHIIDGYEGEELYTESDMERMAEAVKQAESKETYPLPMDMEQFKIDFATALAKLEEASAREENLNLQSIEISDDPGQEVKTEQSDMVKKVCVPANYLKVDKTAIVVGGVIAAAGILVAGICKGVRH